TEQACGDILNRESPETYVVSRYIDNPYLVSERKFDLRVYVLVTSFSPLKAWVYRDGFARFSNTPFSLDTLDDQYVHLTNVAVQKTAPDYDSEKGCKWSVCKLRRFLQAQHGFAKVAELFNRIDMIFVISLLSVQKIMIQDKRCFELYGYDILIDNELKPWLLEINASPSLTASSKEDYILKCNLLDDMLDVVDLEGRLVGDEKRVGDFDLVWDDGPVSPTNRTTAGWIAEAMTVLKPSSNDNTTGSSARLTDNEIWNTVQQPQQYKVSNKENRQQVSYVFRVSESSQINNELETLLEQIVIVGACGLNEHIFQTANTSIHSDCPLHTGCYASSGLTGSMDDLGLAAARNKALALLLGAPHKQAQPPTHRYAPPRSLPTH
ncbi:probable tubulin polyglutamylase TTLL9, partial [Clonorchis sinensis]